MECRAEPDPEQPARHRLAVQFHLLRPRTGEKARSLQEILELTTRAAHEQEQFPPTDWEFVQWLADTHGSRPENDTALVLSDVELLNWLTRWGHTSRLDIQTMAGVEPLEFHGQIAELIPHLQNGDRELAFTHRLRIPGGQAHPLEAVKFFSGRPALALVGRSFYLLRNAPPTQLRW